MNSPRAVPPHYIPCHDILAARCTGYLYAAGGRLRHAPILPAKPGAGSVVTAKVMTHVTNPDDFDTAILFGDAASATVLYGERNITTAWASLRRPAALSACGEDGSVLRVGFNRGRPVRMDGKRVFPQAVRRMTEMLDRACAQAGLRRDDLDLVVPHQANGRIIDAVQKRLGIPRERVFDGIRFTGNTASTSIPLCLAKLASGPGSVAKVGLTAFGGGFTFGATVLEVGMAPGSSGPPDCLQCSEIDHDA